VLAKLSIVIPSNRRVDRLRACLASVTQYAPAGTEVVVVDDASPKGIVSRVAALFGGVGIVRLPQRLGFCGAANAGIENARHPIVEMLNDDTEVTTGWAEAALACFDDPSVAAVAPLVLRWPGGEIGKARIDSAGDRYYWGGVAGKRGHGQTLSERHLERGKVFGASASCALYRRQALVQVGGFPESFGAYFEDVDLAFRLHWAGYEVMYEPASRVLHHVGASYGKPAGEMLEQQARNEERVFWRNLPRRTLLRALPAHLAVVAAKAWRRWRAGELSPFLRGRFRVLGEVPTLLRHRRRLHDQTNTPLPASWRVDQQLWTD
jgi:GT2 family glycosyltransferase